MNVLSKKEPFLLLIGDTFVFAASLWLTLTIRYAAIPSTQLFIDHLIPFGILWLLWIVVFYISGLYEKHIVVLRARLPAIIFRAQITNILFAVSFFYFIPFFGITPKTNLFIYLGLSFVGVVLWRLYGHRIIGPHRVQRAILISSGEEMRELRDQINATDGYNMQFISSIDLENVSTIDFDEEILRRIYTEDVSILAIDFLNKKVEPILPQLYNLLFSRVAFIDMHKIYEDMFRRIPLSLVKYSWFLENISLSPRFTYDVMKRIIDVIAGSLIGLVSLVFYPFVFLLITLDDGGPLFYTDVRVGKNGQKIHVIKFRSMSITGGTDQRSRITRVGAFLRKTRIDELPQLWNVVRGDVSLIGPRPEKPELVAIYEQQIPYYSVRHLIKPGLSGWAQLYQRTPPKFGADSIETKLKLSYDLYYIKHRSLLLDVGIAVKTIKELLSRRGI